jgi:hypothetical protein
LCLKIYKNKSKRKERKSNKGRKEIDRKESNIQQRHYWIPRESKNTGRKVKDRRESIN